MKQNFLYYFNLFKKSPKLTALWTIVIFISFFYSPYLSCFLATFPFAYIFTLNISSPKYFSSKLFIGLLSLIIYITIFQISIYLGWFLYPNTSILGDSLITLFLFLVLLLLLPINNKKINNNTTHTFNRLDLIAIIGAILTILFIAGIPLYKASKLNAENPLIHLMTFSGVDGSTHLAMVNDRIEFDRGILLNTSVESNSRIKGGYPIGWHSANTFFIKALKPTIEPGIITANYYVATTLFWLFALTYFLIRTSGSLLTTLKKPKYSVLTYMSLLSLGVLAVVSFFGDYFTHGFYSYFPVLIASILFLPALLSLFNTNHSKALNGLILPLLLMSLTAQSWLLVAPIFALAIIMTFIEKNKKFNIKSKSLPTYLPTLTFLIAIITVAAIIQTLNTGSAETGTVTTSFLNSILIDGGISKYSIGFYITIAALSVLYFINSKNKNITPIILYMSAATLFIFLVYFIQQYKLQQNTYYYFKLLSVIITIMWTIGIVGGASFIEKMNIKSNLVSIAVSFSVPIFLVFIFMPNLNVYNFVFNRSDTQVNRSNQLASLLTEQHSINNYNKKIITIYDPAGNPEFNEIGSVFLKSNSAQNPCYRPVWQENFAIPSGNFRISSPLLKECQDFHINYVVNNDVINTARQLVSDNGLSDRVTIIPLR